jgi:hypothetical protein
MQWAVFIKDEKSISLKKEKPWKEKQEKNGLSFHYNWDFEKSWFW